MKGRDGTEEENEFAMLVGLRPTNSFSSSVPSLPFMPPTAVTALVYTPIQSNSKCFFTHENVVLLLLVD
jgi:hypothetical protein